MICKDDDNTYAARICNQLQITEGDITYCDWYLPSDAELYQIYTNRTINSTAVANGSNSFRNTVYWSTRENSDANAYF